MLRSLAEQGRTQVYKRGTILIQEGEPGGTLYFVLSGLLRAYSAREDGQEFTYSFSVPGDTLGEVSLDGGLRSASVVAEQDAMCSFVTRATLEQRIAAEPALALELIALLTQRLRNISSKARELALTDAYGRLVLLLRAGSQPLPDGRARMAYPLTQEQMAAQIGCSRSMVTKLLRDLAKGEFLRQEQHAQGRVWVMLKPLPAGW